MHRIFRVKAYEAEHGPHFNIDNTTTVITSTGAKALLNGSGTQMTNNEITTGNRYLIYYNKCDGIFQVINHIVTPTTPAT